jgi:hypothetical protein
MRLQFCPKRIQLILKIYGFTHLLLFKVLKFKLTCSIIPKFVAFDNKTFRQPVQQMKVMSSHFPNQFAFYHFLIQLNNLYPNYCLFKFYCFELILHS